MKAIDRRRVLGAILCSAVAAVAGLALTSIPIEAMRASWALGWND